MLSQSERERIEQEIKGVEFEARVNGIARKAENIVFVFGTLLANYDREAVRDDLRVVYEKDGPHVYYKDELVFHSCHHGEVICAYRKGEWVTPFIKWGIEARGIAEKRAKEAADKQLIDLAHRFGVEVNLGDKGTVRKGSV